MEPLTYRALPEPEVKRIQVFREDWALCKMQKEGSLRKRTMQSLKIHGSIVTITQPLAYPD